MKRHILFIVENNPVPPDVRVWKEINAAKEFGYDVSVICPKHENYPLKYERIQGVDIFRHNVPKDKESKLSFIGEYLNALIWEFYLSLKLYLKKPFHIIHSANPPDHIFIIAIFYKIFNVKFIFDHHDLSPENYVAKFGSKDFMYKILLIMERFTFFTSNLVISTNESYKKIAIDRGGLCESMIYVVRNGPNLDDINFKKPNPKWKNGHQYLVSYVGAIGTQEGLENLLEAIHYLVYDKNISSIMFIVIGNGPDRERLIIRSKKLKIQNFINFTGYIPYDDLYEILETSDLCVNPEHCNEFTDKSTMIKIMDYMTFGKPTVMFKTTEGKVTAKQSAVYVNKNNNILFAETILDLLKKPDLREEMGAYGKERIKNLLHWGIQKRHLESAYKHLIQNSF
ncbi:glycosyltransferase family 4 protein [Thermodesulfobacteriota bacterium]